MCTVILTRAFFPLLGNDFRVNNFCFLEQSNSILMLLRRHFTCCADNYKFAHKLFDFLLEPMFRFRSIFLTSLYTLMLKILGFISKYAYRSSYGMIEENSSNIIGNSYQEDSNSKEESNGNISETGDSVFLQIGLISNSSKYQFTSGKNVSFHLQEPKDVKFLVQEMFLGSDEVLDDEIPQRKNSFEMNLDQNQLQFRFNIFNTNEGSQEHILGSENVNRESADNPFDESPHIKELDNEKEKLSSDDFSYQVERFSTVDVNQESGSALNEKIGSMDDIDEYVEIEPLSLNVTHTSKESTSSCDDNRDYRHLDYDDDDEDERDVLLEHQNLVRQMKMELKKCRVNRGLLPTISEECESPKMVEDFKPLKIDDKIEYKDVMNEIQKFYKGYLEKMRKLDILNYQTLHAISFLQLKDSEVFTAGKKHTNPVTFNFPKIWPRKVQRIHADPIHKSVDKIYHDLELVYVGQLCLSWEILCWLYVKALALLKLDFGGNQSYNRAADEFQQFQIRVQRFMEDEPFQGERTRNYVRSRCTTRSLLQVPTIKDDCLKAKKERGEETDAISLEVLAEIIRESMSIFREFIFADKRTTNVVLKGIHGIKIDLQDPQNSELLLDIISNLRKKARRISEHIRSRNCVIKKFKKNQECRTDGVELLTSQVQLRLISRVLSMSKLTTDQLLWCQNKLKNINFVNKKVHVESSFLLFPC